MAYVAAAAAVYNVYESKKQDELYKQGLKADRALLLKQLEVLNEEQTLLGEVYGQRKGLITDMHGNKMDFARANYSESMIDIHNQGDKLVSGTGFEYSGTAEVERSIAMDKTNLDFKETRTNLVDDLGSALSELGIWKDTELGRIKGEKSLLSTQIKSTKQMENADSGDKWYKKAAFGLFS